MKMPIYLLGRKGIIIIERKMITMLKHRAKKEKTVKPLRVLSLDWDFFVDATATERGAMFPDANENLSQVLADFIWSNRYVENPELANIGADLDAIGVVKDFAQSRLGDVKNLYISNSHVPIYEAVSKAVKPGQPIQVVNVDFHHDCYCNNEKLDCGNWAPQMFLNPDNKLVDSLEGCRYIWVKREDSDTADIDEGMECVQIISLEDLSGVDIEAFDLVFICLSGAWSPPHLDYEFGRLHGWFIGKCSSDIPVWYGCPMDFLDTRYTKEFQDDVEESRKKWVEMMKRVNQES